MNDPAEREETASTWSKTRASAAWIGGLITFMIAVLGAYTGTTEWRSSRAVTIKLTAERYEAGFSGTGSKEIHVGIVNSSARGVTLVAGRAKRSGTRLGAVTGYLRQPDSQGALQSLPASIPPQSSVVAQVGVSVSNEKLASSLDRSTDATSIMLELDFEPGGRRVVKVPVTNEWVYETRTGAQVVERNPWNTYLRLVGREGHVRAMYVTAGEGRQPIPELATLRLWSTPPGAGVATKVTRIASDELPIDQLRPGVYAWAISVGEQVVGTGFFSTPCGSFTVRQIGFTVPAGACGPGG